MYKLETLLNFGSDAFWNLLFVDSKILHSEKNVSRQYILDFLRLGRLIIFFCVYDFKTILLSLL
jgi:hypothetical protein